MYPAIWANITCHGGSVLDLSQFLLLAQPSPLKKLRTFLKVFRPSDPKIVIFTFTKVESKFLIHSAGYTFSVVVVVLIYKSHEQPTRTVQQQTDANCDTHLLLYSRGNVKTSLNTYLESILYKKVIKKAMFNPEFLDGVLL